MLFPPHTYRRTRMSSLRIAIALLLIAALVQVAFAAGHLLGAGTPAPASASGWLAWSAWTAVLIGMARELLVEMRARRAALASPALATER